MPTSRKTLSVADCRDLIELGTLESVPRSNAGFDTALSSVLFVSFY